MIRYDRLVVENLGPYHGEQVIRFPGGGEPAVTQIDGNNGFGKTTLLNCFQWLLYGPHNPKMVNRLALRNKDGRVRAELHFKDGGKSHQISRVAELGDDHAKVTYTIDGVPQENPLSRVRELLPEPASAFFFFDGAKIGRYADLENSREVRESIEMVLGIPVYQNAAKHLKSLKKTLTSRLAKQKEADSSTAELAKAFRETTSQLEAHEEALQALKEGLDADQKEKEALRDQLAKSESARAKLQELEIKERDLALREETKKRLGEAVAAEVRRQSHRIVLPLLQEQERKIRASLDLMEERHDRNEARRHIFEFLDLADAKGFTGRQNLEPLVDANYAPIGEADPAELAQKRVDLGALEQKIQGIEAYGDPTETARQFQQVRSDIVHLKSDIKTLESSLGRGSAEEYRQLQERWDEINVSLARRQDEMRRLEDDVAGLQAKAKEQERELGRFDTGDTDELAAMVRKADEYEALFAELVELARNSKRKSVEKHATALFRKLTRKKEVYDQLRVNPDYTIGVFDKAGMEHPRDQISAGEKQIVALSFIMGLMQSTDRHAPLVIDTPFGHLDSDHRENVITHLPELGYQMVFLTTDMDVKPEHAPIFAKHVGRRYKIRYDESTQTSALAEAS